MADFADILIIGAGPYGLAAATAAQKAGLTFHLVGTTGAFWKEKMPRGMFLRSSLDWHIDPFGEATFAHFVQTQKAKSETTLPIPLLTFIEYLEWFNDSKGLTPLDDRVRELKFDATSGPFNAATEKGTKLSARKAIVATGMEWFKSIPEEFSALPSSRASHTIDHSSLNNFSGKTVAIIGGRQSAFETAAILGEQNSNAQIHLYYRHETPKFVESDWSFMDEMNQELTRNPEWYHGLTESEKEKYKMTAFTSGRLQLEHWLWPRVDKPSIHRHEKTTITRFEQTPGGKIRLTASDGSNLDADHLILATGFKASLEKLPFLDGATILSKIQAKDGMPVLHGPCESSLPGLHFLGMLAIPSYGYPFGFVKGAPLAGRMLYESWSGSGKT